MKRENPTKIEIIGDKMKTYLVGAMECTADEDGGKGWRDYIKPKLEARDIYVFDPSFEEMIKVGMPTKEFHEKLNGLKRSGHWDIYVSEMDKIWKGKSYIDEEKKLMHIMGDKDYVMNSTFITARIAPQDKPCGTYGEIYQAWLFNIPVYLIADMPKSDLNGSLIYWVLSSGGEIFPNWSQYLEHIDKVYKLKEDKSYYEKQKQEEKKDDTKT